MHQDIRLPHLIQSTLESLNQLRRQLTDKTDRITQQERHILNHHLPHRRIQSRKQLILSKYIRLRQQIHQGTLPHIRISHQRKTHHLAPVAPLRSHLPVHLLQLILQAVDPLLHDTPVDFDLGLTHTATRTHATPLPLQVRPHARQSW